MGFTLKLIVHGVPMGHKTWGADDADYKYIRGFYGPTSQGPERMVAEVETINGQMRCYYTFIKGTDVHASDGRPGSYVALTLCANAYYADVQNVYHILSAAYRKMGIGCLTLVQEGIHRFCINDFDSVATQLKEMEQQVINYIGQFSTPDDLVPLTTFSDNKTTTATEINLHECQPDTGLSMMRQAHRLTASPYFPSQHFAKELARRDQELEQVRQQAQQQMQEMQRQQAAAFAKAHQEIEQLQQHASLLKQQNEMLRKATLSTTEGTNQPERKKKKGLLARIFGKQ